MIISLTSPSDDDTRSRKSGYNSYQHEFLNGAYLEKEIGIISQLTPVESSASTVSVQNTYDNVHGRDLNHSQIPSTMNEHRNELEHQLISTSGAIGNQLSNKEQCFFRKSFIRNHEPLRCATYSSDKSFKANKLFFPNEREHEIKLRFTTNDRRLVEFVQATLKADFGDRRDNDIDIIVPSCVDGDHSKLRRSASRWLTVFPSKSVNDSRNKLMNDLSSLYLKVSLSQPEYIETSDVAFLMRWQIVNINSSDSLS